jgi:hypothetical protein
MNSEVSIGSAQLIPFPESAATSTREAGEGSSAATSAHRGRIHTAAGPGAFMAPRASLHSIASK